MCVGADHNMRLDNNIAFDDRICGQKHSLWRAHGYTLIQSGTSQTWLDNAFNLGKVSAVIYAGDFGFIGFAGSHLMAACIRNLNNIGQIDFTTGIVVRHRVKKIKE